MGIPTIFAITMNSTKYSILKYFIILILTIISCKKTSKDAGPGINYEESEGLEGKEYEYMKESSVDSSIYMWTEMEAASLEEENIHFQRFSDALVYVEDHNSAVSLHVEWECEIAFKLFKRNRCNITRKKFARQIITSVASGSFAAEDGTISTPSITVLKNEVNRLNLIVEAFYNQQLELCNKMESCNRNDFFVYCNMMKGQNVPKVVVDRYQKCTDLITKSSSTVLIESIKNIGDAIGKFQEGVIDSDSTKTYIGEIMDRLSTPN